MKNRILIFACIMAATASAASRTATEAFVTNRITIATNALHQSIAPSIDYSTNNVELTNTIAKVAPAPGNYSAVSNAAMNANGNFLAVDGPFFWEAEKAISLKNGFLTLDNTGTGGTTLTMTYEMVSLGYPDSATWRDIIDAANAHAAETVTSNAISTNNPDFVSAVLAAPIAGADQSDLAEIGEYGSYGTVGAAILALIAGLAALKRGKADKTELPYDIVAVTPANGVVTVEPRTIAIYTAGDSAAAFTVAVGTGTTGKARDCELVIDCTATGAVAPTVTWPATFHPRTDAATDFACEAGKRNVYFISEFASGEYAVGGWQETAGGNAS